MEKFLSVIVPTYNMEAYLDKCLSSFLIEDSLMKKLEVLVVNDGSKDSSSTIAHSFADKFPDTYIVIDKTNGNYGSCINAALPVAKGKYVKILDADDYYDTVAFERYFKILCSLDVDLVLNDKTIVDADYSVTWREIIPLEEGVTISFDTLSKCWKAIDMHKMAYRRTLLIEMNYHQTEGISYSDAEWMIKPCALVNTAYNTGENVYNYLQGRAGQTIDKSVRKKSFHSLHILLRSIGDYWKAFDGEADRKKFLFDYFVYSVINIYREFFFTGPFDDDDFRVFDKEMKSNYPEVISIVDNHKWVSFIPNLQLAKDWREGRGVKYSLELKAIKFYFGVYGLLHPQISKNTI